MNPLCRNFFLTLSRMPPIPMLLIICGLVLVATNLYLVAVKDQSSEDAAEHNRVAKSPALLTTQQIPKGTILTASMLDLAQVDTTSVFNDTIANTKRAIGRQVKNDLPVSAQIREADLQ